MSFLAPLLGGVGQGLASGLSGAIQPQPSVASRQSSDYTPITVINAPGVPTLSDIGNLITKINAQNAYNGGLAGKLQSQSPLLTPYDSVFGLSPMSLLLVAGIGVFAILIITRKRGG